MSGVWFPYAEERAEQRFDPDGDLFWREEVVSKSKPPRSERFVSLLHHAQCVFDGARDVAVVVVWNGAESTPSPRTPNATA